MKTLSRRIVPLLLAVSVVSGAAQVPQMISYQGSLKANATNFSGTAQFKFALVNGAGSQTYWSHDGTSSAGGLPASAIALPVTDGVFSVLLGDTTVAHMTVPIPTTVFTNADVKLRIWCSGSTTGFQQLVPDQPLGSAGYAMNSASAGVALSVAPGVVTNTGTVTQVNAGPGLTGGPITRTGTLSIPNGGVNNAMLQNSGITVGAGSGLSGGGQVPLGGTTTLALNLNHDATLTGNGGATGLGLNLANPNTWTAPQTFSSTINGDITGRATGFSGSLAGDVTGLQGATVITNLSATKISGLFKWMTVTGAVVQAQSNTGYTITNTDLVTVTLPASGAVGDVLRLSAPGRGGWKLAQNPGQSILAGNFDSLQVGTNWVARGSSALWVGLACSADGSQVAAVPSSGFISISTDFGATWIARGPSTNWTSIASAADGQKLVAAVNGGFLYTSADAGASWTPRESARSWYGVASSADGSKLAAVVSSGYIYTSKDSGISWTSRPQSAFWVSIASSADGTRLAAGVKGGPPWFSADSGATWYSGGPSGNWKSIACSADGTRMVAALSSGRLYTSTDSGTNWTARETVRNWYGVASSQDGMQLVAVVSGGQIYNSVDAGVTWTPHESNRSWQAVTSSADGNSLAAAVNNGKLYFSRSPAVTSSTTTMPGTAGFLTGGQGTALELQYIGNNQFIPLSCLGKVQAY